MKPEEIVLIFKFFSLGSIITLIATRIIMGKKYRAEINDIIVKNYKSLVEDLHKEVDMLKVEIANLRNENKELRSLIEKLKKSKNEANK